MGVILKIALRNMRRRMSRYILTMITLIIGVALFGGILIASDSFEVMFINSMESQMGSADILIRYDDSSDGWFNSSDLDSLTENIDDIESIAYRISGFYVFVSGTDNGNQIENSTRTAVYGNDYETEAEKSIGGDPYILDTIIEGNSIEELLDYKDKETNDRVIVITESLKIVLGNNFSAGDHIWILPEEGEDTIDADLEDTGTWLEYTVTAIVRDLAEAKDFEPDTPSEVISPSQGFCLWTNINNTHELVDGINSQEGNYTLAAIDVNDINNIASIIESFEDETNDANWVVSDLKSENIENVNDSSALMTTMLLMFGMISLILAIVLIMNIFNIIRREQEYETGMFQAIGASKFEAFRMFLTQGIIMGVTGGIIGTVCSFLFSYFVFGIAMNSMLDLISGISEVDAGPMMGFGAADFEIVLNPGTLLITFMVGVLSCTIAAIYPSWQASRKPIIQCLNPFSRKVKQKKIQTKKRIIYFISGVSLILIGVFQLFGGTSNLNIAEGNSEGFGPPSDITSIIMGPMMILLGIIIITALFISPLVHLVVGIFSPYLRQTRLLTKRNTLRHRKRTVLTFSMIALTISSLVGLSIMISSINEGFNSSIDGIMGSDIRIMTFNTPADLGNELRNLEMIENTMGVNSANILIKNDSKWIGHTLLEENWTISISANVINTTVMKDHMNDIEIISPTVMSVDDMYGELSKNYTTIITRDLANDFNLEINDVIAANFTLGIEYANLSATLEGETFEARESTFIKDLTVIAIVESVPGFEAMMAMGGQSRTSYDLFISWASYNTITINNLPGGSTDIILRQQADTGDENLDKFLPEWFDLSEVAPVIENVSGIEHYTSRMDYSMYTQVGENLNATSVVGIRNETYNNFTSDTEFGSNKIIEKNESYHGSTMEELLSTSDNVCVVHQSFVDYQIENGNEDFGIGSTISIFSDKTETITVPVGVDDSTFPPTIIYETYKIPVIVNFTVIGILEDPKSYSTERYFWIAGYEIGADVSGTEYAIYINNEKAKELIYTSHEGSDPSQDEATSILIHCEDPNDIKDISEILEDDLENTVGGNWTVVDLKTNTLERRLSASQWYIWLEEGQDDEEAVKTISTFIESEGYIVMFAFTKSFISSTFSGMIDLMSYIMSGLLVFAIVIAMIGLVLHCLISTMARRREIGMLRSIGLTKSGVIRTISGETIVIAFLGVFLGLLAGIIQGLLMVLSGPDTGFITFKLSIPWTTIGIILLITTITAILGSLYPSRWAANLNIINAIRTR